MAGFSDPRPPLPEWIVKCYKQLCSHACTSDHREDDLRSIEHEDAIDVLLTDSEFSLEPEDATYALTRLLERGYFYEVGDELRVTTPDEQC
ncbi:hypothetical protein [Natronorubrum thiooxidans]|uniref:Uncharacterized protein n=1 Tax=Natronorubrum thiooxidans TaxID=308853 RepID=A0A1N7H626_9EURY|nr:hypothetical protein [Natronorubrum thiooxidans]SIS20160.1 hypothetical protein SAMN05421752_12617 [Natronorubrum thiooxidans]